MEQYLFELQVMVVEARMTRNMIPNATRLQKKIATSRLKRVQKEERGGEALTEQNTDYVLSQPGDMDPFEKLTERVILGCFSRSSAVDS